jgi:signal peptidase I
VEEKGSQKIKKKSTFREYAEAAVIAILLALVIRTFVVQAFKIPSGSMIPTLHVGDHILVNKFIYGVKIPFVRKTLIPVSKPEREDVIVFIYPRDKSKDYIKRVIGLPGDRIEIIDDTVLINGQEYDDVHGVYMSQGKGLDRSGSQYRYGPVTVPPGRYFVLGDNRDNSQDSRFWGFVPEDYIKGEAFIIYWSWPRWKRIFNLIQ